MFRDVVLAKYKTAQDPQTPPNKLDKRSENLGMWTVRTFIIQLLHSYHYAYGLKTEEQRHNVLVHYIIGMRTLWMITWLTLQHFYNHMISSINNKSDCH